MDCHTHIHRNELNNSRDQILNFERKKANTAIGYSLEKYEIHTKAKPNKKRADKRSSSSRRHRRRRVKKEMANQTTAYRMRWNGILQRIAHFFFVFRFVGLQKILLCACAGTVYGFACATALASAQRGSTYAQCTLHTQNRWSSSESIKRRNIAWQS